MEFCEAELSDVPGSPAAPRKIVPASNAINTAVLNLDAKSFIVTSLLTLNFRSDQIGNQVKW